MNEVERGRVLLPLSPILFMNESRTERFPREREVIEEDELENNRLSTDTPYVHEFAPVFITW